MASGDTSSDESLDLAGLVHELHVQQIELEMQNESLLRAQDELEASRRRYLDLFELAPFGYLTLDGRGAIVEANAAAARLLGLDRATLVGLPFGRFVEAGARERWRSFLEGVLSARDQGPSDFLIDAGERVFMASVSGVVLRGGDGEARCCCALDDVSQERLAEALQRAKESAEDASRAKSEFLARVSHELRTPLSSIQMATELALTEALPERARRFLELALRASEGLLSVISDTLDFAKIEARRIELADEPFELTAALEASLGSLRASAEAKGITFAIDVDPTLPRWVRGDRGRLGQALINLVGNAIRFTARGGVRVVVRPSDEPPSRADGLRIAFVVADTGAGFPPEASEAIFEPFNRAGSGGVGLGLTITRELVGLMGGRIWAVGRPGVGATFSFVVELGVIERSPRALLAGDVEAAPAEARSRTILLAEDDPICRETEAALLERAGHRVIAVEDGQRVLEVLRRRGDVDALVIDVQMPGLDGDEVTRRIRGGAAPGVARDLVVVGLTAVLLAGARDRYLASGMDECLAKPLDVDRLHAALAEAEARRATPPRSPAA
ncbi:MAG: response regulator [Myxococcales bacterium]|nr:response regulator [Myxococcales bacterium]